MGVPISEVGYTIATTRRETTKFRKNMWLRWGDLYILIGHAVSQLVEAQRYKQDGLGFHSGWRHWKFSLT